MRKIFKGKVLFVVGGVFILIVMLAGLVTWGIGNAYRGRILSLEQPPPQEQELIKKASIRKITIKKRGETSCMEVTPDGVVRIYETCGGDLSDASRLTDPRNILKLFRIVSEADLEAYRNSGEVLYELVIETDQGTHTIYVAGGGGGEEIIDTIDQIGGDIPNPSPSVFSSGSPLPPGGTPEPSPSVIPGGPSPTPGSSSPPTGGDNPFLCDFSDSGGQGKPYRVSNVVCSNEPSPAP